MSDINIPPWQFEAHCPECGAKLSIEHKGEKFPVEREAHERLFCPVHGDVMSLEEARRIAFEDNSDDIVNAAKKAAIDSLRKAFKT